MHGDRWSLEAAARRGKATAELGLAATTGNICGSVGLEQRVGETRRRRSYLAVGGGRGRTEVTDGKEVVAVALWLRRRDDETEETVW